MSGWVLVEGHEWPVLGRAELLCMGFSNSTGKALVSEAGLSWFKEECRELGSPSLDRICSQSRR